MTIINKENIQPEESSVVPPAPTQEATDTTPMESALSEAAQKKIQRVLDKEAAKAKRAAKAEKEQHTNKQATQPKRAEGTLEDYHPPSKVRRAAMTAGKFILLALLAVVFIRGLTAFLQPTGQEQVEHMISSFRAELDQDQGGNAQIMAFAQNFAREYMTYTPDGESDYTARISRYASDNVANLKVSFPKNTAATVLYAQAYRTQAYSENQTDVWVLLTVQYAAMKDKTEQPMSTETIVLKIPVYCDGNYYIVEDTPLFVNDSVKLSNYPDVSYYATTTGKSCTDEEIKDITTTLSNFYSAYYGNDQSVVNYYLLNNQNWEDFLILDNHLSFKGVKDLEAYDEDSNGIVAIATVIVSDQNGLERVQNYNLHLQHTKGRYYVTNMNARHENIKVGG